MKVHCFTNIDNLSRAQWPDKMCCRPMKGDTVASKDGKHLKIVQIIHDIDRDHEPYLLIELHNR